MHAAARPAKGVLNALSLTKDSHKPVLKAKPFVRTEECDRNDCERPTFQKNLCKHHFSSFVKKVISKQLQKMYRGPENAFNSMDFSGRGYILEEDLLSKYFLLRCKLTLEDA